MKSESFGIQKTKSVSGIVKKRKIAGKFSLHSLPEEPKSERSCFAKI